MIEIELKKEKTISGPGAECFCGEKAVKTVVIGQVENHYGTDYDICEKERCLELALDNEGEDVSFINSHREEIVKDSKWDLREGK